MPFAGRFASQLATIQAESAEKQYRVKSAPTSGIIHIPTLGVVNAQAGGTSLVYGSYVEITPGLAWDAYLISLAWLPNTASRSYFVSVARGGAGSESNIMECYMQVPATLQSFLTPIPVNPVFLPAGTRLSARIATSNGFPDGASFGVQVCRASDLEAF